MDFADHHWYTGGDLQRLQEELRMCGAVSLVTTQKDFVRLQALGSDYERFVGEVPMHVLKVEPEFIAGEDELDLMIGRMSG